MLLGWWTCATKFEKDGKVYAGSERGFKHLTKPEDMVISQNCHSLVHYRWCSSYSSMSLQTSYLILLCVCVYGVCISQTKVCEQIYSIIMTMHNTQAQKRSLHNYVPLIMYLCTGMLTCLYFQFGKNF